MIAQAHSKIKSLLPRGYGKILADLTGCHPEHARYVVRLEITTADIWPDVIKLAKDYQQELSRRQQELDKLKAA